MLEANSGSTDRQRWTPSLVVMTSLLISSGPWSHKWRLCSFRRILFSLFARLLYWRSRRWNIQPNATRRTPCRRNSSMILTSRYISWWLLRPIMSFSPICTKQTSNFDRFLPRSSCRRWSIVRLPVPWASPEKGRSEKRSNKKSEFHFIFKLRISGYESFTFRFLSRLYVSVVWKLDVKMPKRKITVTAKSTFWPCGSCRRNCANTNSICCDSCKQRFHTDCENFPSEYLHHFNSPKVTNACNACFSAEIGDTNYNYAMGLNRLLQVFIYLFIYRGDRGTLGHGEH